MNHDLKIIVHRGRHEIGGSCVELIYNGSRIIIDIGMPLVNESGNKFDFKDYRNLSGQELVHSKILPDISGFYLWDTEQKTIDGLLLSHAHLDHYGLIHYVRPDITCYLGQGTKRIIDITRTFLGSPIDIQNYSYLESGKAFYVGAFEVTPYLMDHSAFDAYAFAVAAGKKKILYSGDFREHGRKSKAFYWFLKNAPQKTDALLLEGSTLGRENAELKTERRIEDEITDAIISSKGIVFCIVSGQNIDRLVSFYKAALRTKRLFVVDIYTANVLDTLKDLAKIPFPSGSFERLRVFYPYSMCNRLRREGKEGLMYKFRAYKISKKEIAKNPGKILMIARQSMINDLSMISNIRGSTIIYSMWEGYLQDKSMAALVDFIKKNNIKMTHIHTSGHAVPSTLKKVVAALRPKRIIPIHTFHPEQYQNLFPEAEVLSGKDGLEIKIE